MSGINSKHLKAGDPQPKTSSGRLTLFNMRFCPYAQRAMLVALKKNLDFDTININLTKKPEWYESINPLMKVPSVQKGDFMAYESMVVAEYLDDKYPETRLTPDTPEQKAQDNAFVAAHGAKLLGGVYGLYKAAEEKDLSPSRDVVKSGLQFMENELEKRATPYFGGQNVKLVDYNVWPWFERIFALEQMGRLAVAWDEYPLLNEWLKLMEKDSAVAKYRITTDYHVKFIESAVAGNPEYNLLVGQ